jgi:predicted TIM-barrel fold metal-dependent hydrolase
MGDGVRELVQRGQPLDGCVIDAHAHIGPWFNFSTPAWDAQALVHAMDRLGIDVACVSATAGFGPDARAGNDQVATAIARYPDRLLGYVAVNPNESAQLIRELQRLTQGEGFIGVKMHPMMHQLPLDGVAYAAAFEAAASQNAPVLMHIWLNLPGGDPENVIPLAERYPTAPLIMGHAGGEVAGIRRSIEIAMRFPNVYLDLVGSAMYAGMIEEVVDGIGPNRLLFGTDCTFFDARPQVGRIAFAALPESVKRQVLGHNMRRVLLACNVLPDVWRRHLED